MLRELEQLAQREKAAEHNATVIRGLQRRLRSHPDHPSGCQRRPHH